MTGKALQHQPGEPSIVNVFPRDPLEQAPKPAPLKNSCPHPAHYSLIFLRIAGILKKFSFLDPFQLVSAHSLNESPPTSPKSKRTSPQCLPPLLEANPWPLCILRDCRIVASGHHYSYNRYLGNRYLDLHCDLLDSDSSPRKASLSWLSGLWVQLLWCFCSFHLCFCSETSNSSASHFFEEIAACNQHAWVQANSVYEKPR